MRVISPAADLELTLGDPLNPRAPISFAALVEHDEREAAPAEAFEALRQWGVHAHLVPKALGGHLESLEDLLALVRVVSRRDLVLTTGLGSTMLAAIPVWAWGSDDQRRQVADLLLGQGAFGSFAVSERNAGSDFAATITRADEADGGYLLFGEKWLIGNASRSSFVVALARTGRSLSLVYLRPNQLPAAALRRLPRIPTLGLRGHDLGGLAFADCRLPPGALLEPAGRGMEMALTTLHYTRTMVAGMALGAADTALRLALGWGCSRRLYGESILAIPAVRALLLGAFLDILIGECLAIIAARALTFAPRRASLWTAVTKYLVPKLCERVVRDAATVLSARSYLREGVAGGVFQKIARDVPIAGIFEGTSLVQLSLIESQLVQLKKTGRRDPELVDLDRLGDLGSPAPYWDPVKTRLRVGDPGGDELVERWFGQAEDPGAGPRVTAALQSLQRNQRMSQLAAHHHCVMHAAACCVQVWRSSRYSLAPEARGAEWLSLCLERLAGGSDSAPGGADLNGSDFAWMLGQLDRGELFSLTALELAR